MTIDSALRAKICRMARVDGMAVNAIAETLQIHHSTVKRAQNQAFSHSQCERQFPPSLLKYQPLIVGQIEKYPKIQGKSLKRLLTEMGIQVSVTTCIRALRFLRNTKKQAFGIRACLPGQEAQFDWGEKVIEVGGKRQKIYIFVMVLSYSRNLYAHVTPNMRAETLTYFHTQAFKWFGAVPKRILFDNMKTVIIERVGEAIRFSKSFYDFSAHYLFEPAICHVRTPQEKGRVERQVGVIKNNFFNARVFGDIDDVNAQLNTWLLDRLGARHPDEKSKTIQDAFNEEKHLLLPLPAKDIVFRRLVVASVGKQPYVSFETNRYSIPPEHIHTTLRLLVSFSDIEIYRGGDLIALHPRCYQRDKIIDDKDHLEALLSKRAKPTGATYRRGYLIRLIPALEEIFLDLTIRDQSFGSTVSRIQLLIDRYGLKAVEEVVSNLAQQKNLRIDNLELALSQMAQKSGFDGTQDSYVMKYSIPKHLRDIDTIHRDLDDY